jgi:transcriptional regulator GlxA family with amidase domain
MKILQSLGIAACGLGVLGAPTLAREAQEPSAAGAAPAPLHLGIVLYPGFEPLDVFGPLEMFMNVGSDRLRVHMIAQEAGLVPSSAGAYPASIAPKVHADVALADAPPLDIIMVPGGFGTIQQLQNETLLSWLRERAPRARFTTSVCSGSAILAKAGLLDDRKATSNKQLFSFIAAQGPDVEWVKSARWVEDGAILTSSGVSAGIDMALALIAKLFGAEVATAIANGTEYEWHRDPDQDPFTQYLDQAMPGLAAGGAEP